MSAPLVLALETATLAPSVALLAGEAVLAVQRAPQGEAAAAFVLPAVEAVLAGAGRTLGQVEAVALAIGPGSFTGLRVGLATVKGLCFGSDRGVAAVPTLLALCLAAGSEDGPVAAVLDARRGEVYAAAHGPALAGEGSLLREGLYRVDDLAGRLPAEARICGDAAAILPPALRERAAPLVRPAAVAVGRLGLRRLAAGHLAAAADLVPRYLRRAEAEARRTGQALEPDAAF